jgi:hypothetical protein
VKTCHTIREELDSDGNEYGGMMSARSLALIAFPVTGTMALLYSIFQLQSVMMIPCLTHDGSTWYIYTVRLLTLALLLGLGLLLIFRREQLAAWISQGDTVSRIDQDAAVERPGITALAFALLGLYLMITTFPRLGSLAGQLIRFRETANPETPFLQSFQLTIGEYLGSLARLLVGGYLFIDANRFSAWWHRRRKEPVDAQCDPDGVEPSAERT